jgi:poly(3-hydroxybutyrate) depolymerase
MLHPIAGHSARLLPSGHWSRRSQRPALGTLALGVALSVGCSDEGADTSTGGTGGANTGGIHTGGTSTGGTSTGGMSTGGVSTGGTSAGGTSTGGTSTGGTAATSGGVSSGGTSNAGAMNGGSSGAPGGTTGAAGTPGAGGAAGGGGAAGAGGAAGGSGGAKMSAGCTTTPATLKSATVNQATPANSIMVGGQSRQFLTRWPANYDNKKAYPLHIGLHGANGNISENGRDNFGLWSLSQDSVIFVTLVAMGGLWSAASDLTYADAVLKQVQSELCIDTSKIVLQGFSQGAAMSWYLTGSRPGVFRAVIGHSGGGVQGIPMLSPVAYFGSLGTGEGGGQNTQTDQFAKANGCTIDTLPRAETGKHVCTPYAGCKDGFPVTWCSYDGGHGFQDTDSGSSKSWVPEAVWAFLTPLLM